MSATTDDSRTPIRSHRTLLMKLLAIVALSFVFGFALVPLYDALCVVTGLNGKTAGPPKAIGIAGIKMSVAAAPSQIDRSRVVTVEFIGTVMPGLPWDMHPLIAKLELHPGELQQALYRVHNNSDKLIVGQAIPSVAPGLAAQYFHKLDCFCFRQQTLAPGETKDLPVTFIVKRDLDEDIRTITLAYAFYNTADSKTVATSLEAR